MITVVPKQPFKAPVVAECISPDSFAQKQASEIADLPVWEGNRKRTLSQLFKTNHKEISSDKPTIRIRGDFAKVKRIGAKMSFGSIIVEGNAGMHLGEEMKGGTITLAGDAGSWAGSRMKGGTIEIKGNASHYVGAAYRGSTMGMRGGTIIIHGNAGNEIGCFMRKGLIKVYGDVGQFAGIHMKNGTIFIQGNSEGRAGAEMRGGRIIVGGHIPSILPTFTIDDLRSSTKVARERIEGPFYRFIGDLAEGGKGKLFVSQAKNPHLSAWAQYL